MVHIETVDLSPRGVTLPSDRVGMVIAQPYLSLTATEPYRCTPEAKPQQMQMLRDTVSVALAVRHGAPKTHFTVFPEYSISGLDGIALLETAIRADEWPAGTIVIGGTDALSKLDLVTLAGQLGTHMDTTHNCLDRIAHDEWINCGITWVKAGDGTVERWLQPKLFPAWLEQDVTYQGMFRGNSVFTFKGPLENGTQYHFCSLICFDWVATLDNQRAWQWVFADLRRQVTPAELSLSWFFVIQCNQKPSHDSFLTEVSNFFNQNTIPNVRRDRTCLVFANSAGKQVPGRTSQYGSTSLVFSRQNLFVDPKCHMTFSNGGPRFRSSTLLSAYHDVFFRERGACIHSLLQVNPASLTAGAAGRACAVENAFVFPFNGATDRRAPSAPVPACVKWLNDELDELPRLSASYPTTALAPNSDIVHQQTVAALRTILPQSVEKTVKMAATDSTAENADGWGQTEADALEHLVHTLDIIGIGFTITTVGAEPAHATVVMSDQTVDILAIRGYSHDRCRQHSESFLPLPRRQVILISRDRDNNSLCQKFRSILDPNIPKLGEERDITDPGGGLLHLGYRNLLDIFQQATTATALQGAIDVALAA